MISLLSLSDLDERILKQQQEEEERKRQRRERKKEKKVGRIDSRNTSICEADFGIFKVGAFDMFLNFVVLIYILFGSCLFYVFFLNNSSESSFLASEREGSRRGN